MDAEEDVQSELSIRQQAPEPKSGRSETPGDEPGLRQIRVGKDFAFVVNGQRVVLFAMPQKVGPKSHIVLPGYHLNIYDQVALRAGQARYSPVNFHRAYGDTEPLSFDIPDFNQLLKEGDPVWIELLSSSVPEASGLLFPYLAYTKQSLIQSESQEEGDEEGEEAEKKGQSSLKAPGRGQQSATAMPTGLGGLAVAAGGEAISGVLGFSTQQNKVDGRGKKLPLKERLKQALQSGDRQALKDSIEEAKLNRNAAVLQEISRLARSAYEKMLFEEALGHLGVVDFSPRQVSGGLFGGGKGSVTGETVRRATIINNSGTASSEVKLGPTVAGSSVTSANIQPGKAEGSFETGAGETVSSLTTVTGRGGTAERKFTGRIKAEVEQEINVDGKLGFQVKASPGRVNLTNQVFIQENGEVGQEVSDIGSSKSDFSVAGEAAVFAETVPGKAQINTRHIRAGEPGSTSATGEVQTTQTAEGDGSARFSSNLSDTLQHKIVPEKQSRLATEDAQAGLAGEVREKADVTASVPKNFIGTPAAKMEIGAQVSAPSRNQAPSQKLVHKNEKSESVEAIEESGSEGEKQVLAQIPKEAKRLAATFKSRAVFGGRKGPGVTLGSDKSGLLAIEQRLVEDQASPKKKTVQGQQAEEPAQGVDKDQKQEKGDDQTPAKLHKISKERSAVGISQASKVIGAGGLVQQPEVPVRTGGTGLRLLEKPENEAETSPEGQPAEPQQEEIDTEAKKTEEQEQEDAAKLQQEQQVAEQQSRVVQAFRQAKINDESLKKVVKEANLALDRLLMQGVELVWAGAIETFGLTVLLGAIIGDFLWMFKSSIVKGVLKPLLRTEFLRQKAEQIAKQIKISVKVKLNIVAMNAILAAIALIVVFILTVIFWVGCHYPPVVSKLSYKFSVSGLLGGASMCEALDNMVSNFSFGGGSSGGGGASDSWGSPDGLLSTNQWTGQINQAAAKYSVDTCVLRVVVQKESAGQANIIGCDCAANGKPELCPAGARSQYYPGYPFNWDQCSYGIGLTQWTIYPRSSSQNWNRWENSGTPSRNLFGDQYYYLNDFLNPQTSLDLTARYFQGLLAQSGGDVAGAFRAYMGSGAPQSWVDQRMALYNMCKASSGQ